MGLLESFNRWEKILWSLKTHERRFELIENNIENLVNAKYKALKKNVDHNLASKEYSIYSQNGEDGILLYIFSVIGVENRRFIEFGIGDGQQCNSANLILNFGWKGLMIEGNQTKAEMAELFYSNTSKTKQNEVIILNEFITKENINELFESANSTGEIDLLSIDIDGNDYWVFEAIKNVDPRVIVIEYNASFGPDKSVTVEYDPSFSRFKKHPSGWYHGASLKALTKLANDKGYELIGCDSCGVNAFFVKRELLNDKLEKISPEEAYYKEKKRSKTHTPSEQFDLIKHLPLIKV
ncbi:FkbM family methyltransferase [Gracilimonas mengyeensis]|uniref:Methyltransferase FkbM domain-containing protein n=1 Tax=Gracilimonas mengyeensis TaxID=1302730 RepID=A0A521EGU4_9BACT|nr:FkbM family methyltransferase [Gracilimonas mengyeensis]SMO83135.1 Methyltransferase FkbM domain-containing protein [Gracilimonas mengyeensis]